MRSDLKHFIHKTRSERYLTRSYITLLSSLSCPSALLFSLYLTINNTIKSITVSSQNTLKSAAATSQNIQHHTTHNTTTRTMSSILFSRVVSLVPTTLGRTAYGVGLTALIIKSGTVETSPAQGTPGEGSGGAGGTKGISKQDALGKQSGFFHWVF